MEASLRTFKRLSIQKNSSNGEWLLMSRKKNSNVITKTDCPEFFEILEKSLGGIKVPKIIIKESQTLSNAQAARISYSICFNRRFWDRLTILEKVAVSLHEIGHLTLLFIRFIRGSLYCRSFFLSLLFFPYVMCY